MAANFDGLRFSHWQTELRADGIVVLAFDRQGTSVNAFSQDVLIELADILARLTIDPPKGMVLRSAQASGFIAGGALMGVVGAILKLADVDAKLTQWNSSTAASWVGLGMYLALIIYFAVHSLRAKKEE